MARLGVQLRVAADGVAHARVLEAEEELLEGRRTEAAAIGGAKHQVSWRVETDGDLGARLRTKLRVEIHAHARHDAQPRLAATPRLPAMLAEHRQPIAIAGPREPDRVEALEELLEAERGGVPPALAHREHRAHRRQVLSVVFVLVQLRAAALIEQVLLAELPVGRAAVERDAPAPVAMCE